MAAYDDLDPVYPIPAGPSGGPGAPGAPGGIGPAGKNAFTRTTGQFIQPAEEDLVTVPVVDTDWMAAGQAVYVESAGYFTVASILGPTSAQLRLNAVGASAATGSIIEVDRRVTPGGFALVDNSQYDALSGRVTSLETAPGGTRTFYGATAPTGAAIGDIWFKSDDGNRVHRWDGSAWVDVQKVLALPDFGTGLRPIQKVDTLEGLVGAVGDFVLLTTDQKLYRWTTTGWSRAIDGADLFGQVDGALVVDGTLIASKFAANSVTAAAVGTNLLIANSANIGEGVITDAHIANLSAGKVTAGDLQAVNLGYSGRLFNPAYPNNKYRATVFHTVFAASYTWNSGLAYGFNHHPGLVAYGPGHASWGLANTAHMSPDTEGRQFVQIQGRLLGYTGLIAVYYRKNGAGQYNVLAARSAADAGDAILDCQRLLTGLLPTDSLEFFVAPSDGNGNIGANVTCQYQLDVVFNNW